MSAHPKHIAKYASLYRALFPTTPLLVLTISAADFVFRSHRALLTTQRPALDLLLALPASARILLATYSNGGCASTTALAASYHAACSRPLPIAATVLDSCPGRLEAARAMRAFEAALPTTPVVRPVLGALLRLFYAGLVAWLWVTGSRDPIQVLRERLNDAELVRARTPRVYVYSREDVMVAAGDVEEHAAEAGARGWEVELERFEGSKHVAHLLVDTQRYRGIVERVWEEGRGGEVE